MIIIHLQRITCFVEKGYSLHYTLGFLEEKSALEEAELSWPWIPIKLLYIWIYYWHETKTCLCFTLKAQILIFPWDSLIVLLFSNYTIIYDKISRYPRMSKRDLCAFFHNWMTENPVNPVLSSLNWILKVIKLLSHPNQVCTQKCLNQTVLKYIRVFVDT